MNKTKEDPDETAQISNCSGYHIIGSNLALRGDLPPELQGLADLSQSERFAHFIGVQVRLKDKDNRPFTLNVIPGTATSVRADSVTVAANDGSIKMFTLNDGTIIPRHIVPGGAQVTQRGVVNGDSVVVLTLDDEITARAVVSVSTGGPGSSGFGGPPGWGPPWLRQR